MTAEYRKKFFIAVSACAAVFISAVLLTGCSLSTEKAAVDTFDLPSNTSDFNTGDYFDLNSGKLFNVSEKIVSDSMFVIDEAFYTNSEAITVTNNSDSPIDIFLFQKDTPEQAIQQFTLNANASQSFTNLTSRFLYQIGIKTAADSSINLTISK